MAGFPTKVVESLALGTPVITNLTSDLGFCVFDGRNGVILDARSEQDASPEAVARTGICPRSWVPAEPGQVADPGVEQLPVPSNALRRTSRWLPALRQNRIRLGLSRLHHPVIADQGTGYHGHGVTRP